MSRFLAYLSAFNSIYVTTPMREDIIKKQAGGMHYVHGGSSLQEMIIPMVKLITAKGLVLENMNDESRIHQRYEFI